jgi:hypothetical protein
MNLKFLIVALVTLNAHAASFDFSMSAFSLKETAMLSRGTSSSIETKLSYLIEDDLKLNFWPGANFSSGQQASRDQVNVLANTIFLKEASAEKMISSMLYLKAGALYQKEFLPGISGQSKAFPGIGARFQFEFTQALSAELLAQAAVPTSTGLATNSSELQSNATLISGTVNLKLDLIKNFKSQLSYSHFSFNDLTSTSAFDSAYRGNSVSKINSNMYNFVYGYQGDEVIAKISYTGSFIDLGAKAGAIKNNLAPTQMSLGYFVSLEPGLKINENNLLRLIASGFRVESDAMVSVFSDSAFGRTNRAGNRFGLAVEKKKYTYQLLFSRSSLITSNAFQSDDESIALDLAIKEISF